MDSNICKKRTPESFVNFIQELNRLERTQNNILWEEKFAEIKTSEYVILKQEDYILKVVKPEGYTEDADPDKSYAMKLFQKLFECNNIIKTKDGIHMYLCNGFLNYKGDVDRSNPMLKQRVFIEFDPEQNAIMVKCENYDMNFNVLAFINAECIPHDIDVKNAMERIEGIEEENLFLYDEKVGNALSEIVNTFTSQGVVTSEIDTVSNDVYMVYFSPCITMEQMDGDVEGFIRRLRAESELNKDCYSSPFLKTIGLISSNITDPARYEETGETLLLPINAEQRKALDSAYCNDITVVQGPPGTGKTHMSVNMIAKAVQNGENVLFTSRQKSSIDALYSLIPEKIRKFCIVEKSDESKNDIIKTIGDLEFILGSYSVSDVNGKIESVENKKKKLKERLNSFFKRLNRDEGARINVESESYTVEELGAYIFDYKELLRTIPGSINRKFDLTDREIVRLYETNDIQNEWFDLRANRIDTISPELLQEKIDLKRRRFEINLDKLYKINKYIEALDRVEWVYDAATEFSDGIFHKLKNSIEGYLYYKRKYFTNGRTVELGQCTDELLDINIPKIADEIAAKGKINKFAYIKNPDFRTVLKEVRIKGQKIKSVEDCKAVGVKVLLDRQLRELMQLYDVLCERYHTLPFFEDTGDAFFEDMLKPLDLAFDFPEIYEGLKSVLIEMQVSEEVINMSFPEAPESETIKSILDRQAELQRLYGELDIQYNEENYTEVFKSALDALDRIMMQNNTLYDSLRISLERADIDTYKTCYDDFKDEYDLYMARQNLLSRMERYAPAWAEAIMKKQGIHGASNPPEHIHMAIKVKKMLTELRNILPEDKGEIFSMQIEEIAEQIDGLQQEFVYLNMMKGILEKYEKNSESYGKDLRRFKLTVEKIGAGKGKKAKRLKEEYLDVYYRLRELLPIWIIPMRSLYDFKPVQMFDLMICDEASTSDVKDTLILNLTKRAMIIGDPEQVMPIKIGVNVDGISAIQSQFLVGFEEKNLYDESTSLFNIAAMNVNPIMLRRHYRCHPSIIKLSNELSYNGCLIPIKPSLSLLDPVIDIKVDDGEKKSNNVNAVECDTVISIVKELIAEAKYDGLTIGIISLKGANQAKIIQRKLLSAVSLSDIEKHKIISENVSSFQGLERDVIIISCVDSAEDDEILRLEGKKADNPFKKRLNVAFSRGKKQIFVIHSYDKNNLDIDDLRQYIFREIEAVRNKDEEDNTAMLSGFEQDVYEECKRREIPVKAGMNTECGSVSLCVLDAGGKPVILQCVSPESDELDMDRLEQLRHQGFRIRYVFAEEFYTNLLEND